MHGLVVVHSLRVRTLSALRIFASLRGLIDYNTSEQS